MHVPRAQHLRQSCALSSVGIRLRANICHSLLHAVDSIGLLVRYLNAEFFLYGHDHLHCVQAVKSEVVCEVGCAGDFALICDL